MKQLFTTTDAIPGKRPEQIIARTRDWLWLKLLHDAVSASSRPASFKTKWNCLRREWIACKV